ncbi:hypothetical protein A2Y99_03200 [Candidatus Gottesmanbacteria bacterium RBG_13_37_7]|uniref:YjeF C-terminal domain-containing protein n=1 Tax=Candidatus Gottesmanbacteria bacterium RBG_13_37_7 TaxID=1798369 RepID=A0A1F5YHB0_9BACT|nr:MAG: hypothetical protein A2Y99_03200 [Candidatus Gottesmanbacteria bacterium RBG_13_37_7]
MRAKHAVSSIKYQVLSIRDIEKIKDEGLQTYFLTKYLLQKYPHKRWMIDAGALQMMEPEWIPEGAILTPHSREFKGLISRISNFPASPAGRQFPISNIIQNDKKPKYTSDGDNLERSGSRDSSEVEELLKRFVKQYNCIILLKGKIDYIASKNKIVQIQGGNAGMTKGGTGDVLAGLVAALYCKNDAFTSAVCASYINKKAGEELFTSQGYWFNASDLARQIPITMKRLIL